MVNYDLEMIKKEIKNRKKNNNNSFFYILFNKFLITCLVTVICLICFKKNKSFKDLFYDKVLSVNFNFSFFNEVYKKYLGDVLPFGNLIPNTTPVFSEKLVYSSSESFLDGVSLNVGANYMVPSIGTGLVVFVGDKEGYGNTVIIQGPDGVDTWYSNMSSISANIYEYVNKGDYIGGCDNNLVLVFKKDGNVLDYKKYI